MRCVARNKVNPRMYFVNEKPEENNLTKSIRFYSEVPRVCTVDNLKVLSLFIFIHLSASFSKI